MGALSKNERDGLEDVFLSIHNSTDKYKKIKFISTLIMTHTTAINIKKLLKVAKYGLKETKISAFFLKYTKKKKNLSK